MQTRSYHVVLEYSHSSIPKPVYSHWYSPLLNFLRYSYYNKSAKYLLAIVVLVNIRKTKYQNSDVSALLSL